MRRRGSKVAAGTARTRIFSAAPGGRIGRREGFRAAE
jgi:hypothetical protein